MNPEQNGGPQLPQYQPQPQPGNQSPPTQGYPQPQPAPPQPIQPQPPVGFQPHPPIDTNPYDFIMNPGQPAKKPLVPIAGGNPVIFRIVIFIAGIIALIILAAIVISILGSGGKDKTEALLTVAQEQTELIRITTAGSQKATTLPLQTLTQNVQAVLTSDNNTLLAYMTDDGQKTTPAQLNLKKSATVDTTLMTAQENNTYDTALKDVIQTDLTSYMSSLQKAYKLNPGPKGQELISKQYDSAELLLKLSKQN